MSLIESIEVRGLEYQASPLNRDRWGDIEHACMLAITADGQTGYSLTRCNLGLDWRSVGGWLLGTICNRLLGADPADHESIYRSLSQDYAAQFLPVFPLSLIDVALWDLRGKLSGQPVCALLARSPKTTVEAYASLPRFSNIDEGIESALEQAARGFSGVKVHYSGDLPRDLDLSHRIRDALPTVELAFDASNALTYEQAVQVGRAYLELRGAWVEEPFEAFDFAQHSQLRQDLEFGIPIVGFETAPGGHRAAELAILSGAFDQIEVDCLWKGGITGAHRTATFAANQGKNIVIHHGGSPSMNLANIHLVAAMENVDAVGLTLPVHGNNLAVRLPEIDSASGLMPVPTAPGLGQQVDWEFVAAHEVGRERRAISA